MIIPQYDKHHDRWQVHSSLTNTASNWRSIWEWCWETFGHPGTDPKTGVKSDWNYQGGWIYFYNEKYVTMFILRWA